MLEVSEEVVNINSIYYQIIAVEINVSAPISEDVLV